MQQRTPAEVLSLIESEGIEIVDFRFCDLPGLMQHFSVPAHELTEDVFEDGLGFDGSSIRGFQEIQESDMLLMPDPLSWKMGLGMKVAVLLWARATLLTTYL